MKRILVLLLVTACSNESNLGNTSVAGHASWSLALGGRGYDTGTSIAIDSHGFVIVAGGGWQGVIDFGHGAIGTLGAWSFVVKRDGDDGSPIWEHAYPENVTVRDVAIGAGDAIYVTGSYAGIADFGGISLTSATGDMFVAKYASDGGLIWVSGLGAKSDAMGIAIAVDQFDNAYVVANSGAGSFTFANASHVSSSGNAIVASFTGDGAARWARTLDPLGTAFLNSVSISPTGDVLFSGNFSLELNFDGETVDANARSRALLVRLHADGSFVWARVLGDAGNETDAGQISIDATDRIATSLLTSYPLVNDHVSSDRTLETFAGPGTHQDSYPVSTGGRLASETVQSDGTRVSPEWIDGPYNADHRDQVEGHLEIATVASDGGTATIEIGQRLWAGLRPTVVHDVAVGPNGEIAVVGDLGGEVLAGPTAIATHGTDDTDALVIMIPAQH